MIKTNWLFTFLIIANCLVVGCSKQNEYQAQGYIEGKYIYLSSSFAGKLTTLNASRGTLVKAGQQLYTLEAQPENADLQSQQQQVAQAQASIAQATAAFNFAKMDLQRKKTLLQKNVIQQAAFDEAQASYDQQKARKDQAVAQYAAATAGVDKATWAKTQKTVNSPANGFIFDTYYQPGEIVAMGQPVVSLLTPENIKAIFYVSEIQLAQLKLAAPIALSCDRCTDKLKGKISYISAQAEYTPPVIFSTETRTKLVYRIEAEFNAEIAKQLHPGQPITVNFDTNRHV